MKLTQCNPPGCDCRQGRDCPASFVDGWDEWTPSSIADTLFVVVGSVFGMIAMANFIAWTLGGW